MKETYLLNQNFFPTQMKRNPQKTEKGKKIGAVDTVKFKACNGYSIIL